MEKKKKTLSRDEASALYQELQKNFLNMVKRTSGPNSKIEMTEEGMEGAAQKIAKIVSKISTAKTAPAAVAPRSAPSPTPPLAQRAFAPPPPSGAIAACMTIVFAVLVKVTMSLLEVSGLLAATPAIATMAAAPEVQLQSMPSFSAEELTVLTALDSRRTELEGREKKLSERSKDLERQEREFAVRLTELRELSERLKQAREGSERQSSAKIDQLANVYGSMNPPEAAKLIEQLDVAMALPLLERLPEKRLAQILSLMQPEKALQITKMMGAPSDRGGR